MGKFTASTVKGLGFVMNRTEGQPFYNIAHTHGLKGKQSPNVGYAYKNASDGTYTVVLALTRTTHDDFNAVKRFLGGKLAS